MEKRFNLNHLQQGISAFPPGVQKNIHRLLYGKNTLSQSGFISFLGLEEPLCTDTTSPCNIFDTANRAKVSAVEVTPMQLKTHMGIDIAASAGALDWSTQNVILKLNKAGVIPPSLADIEMALSFSCEGVSYTLFPESPHYNEQLTHAQKIAKKCDRYGLVFLCGVCLKKPQFEAVSEALKVVSEFGHLVRIPLPTINVRQRITQTPHDMGVKADDPKSMLVYLKALCGDGCKGLIVDADKNRPLETAKLVRNVELAGISADSVFGFAEPEEQLTAIHAALSS